MTRTGTAIHRMPTGSGTSLSRGEREIVEFLAPYLDSGERFNGSKIAGEHFGVSQGTWMKRIERLIAKGVIRRAGFGQYEWAKRPVDLQACQAAEATKRKGPNVAPGITLQQLMGRR